MSIREIEGNSEWPSYNTGDNRSNSNKPHEYEPLLNSKIQRVYKKSNNYNIEDEAIIKKKTEDQMYAEIFVKSVLSICVCFGLFLLVIIIKDTINQ